MANYSQISYGSRGEDVTSLQELLKNNGYADLEVDGIFGSQTQAAVKDYQQKNGLAVDGIVGTNTWGALTGGTTTQTPDAPTGDATGGTTEEQKPTGFTYEAYAPSDTVKQAEEAVRQYLAQKPGAYQSAWQAQLDDTINKIMNREKFSYDLNGDALYQQYKDQYTTQGKLAMMDAMGQAQAMSGGYGNSYAQTVGQQAYQGYLQQLNDRVPELYQLALDQYNREGQDLYNQYSLYADREEQDYGRYRDSRSDYYTDLGLATDEARYQAEQDYGRYMDGFNIAYGQYRDQKSDEQWQAEFDEAKRQYDQQYELAAGKSSGGSSSNGTRYTGGAKYTANPGWDAEKISRFQEAHKLDVDGVWGPQTAAAYDKDSGWVDPGADNPGGGGETENTRTFMSSIMTRDEFAGHGNRATVNGKTYTSYSAYVEACLAKWTDSGVPQSSKTLTDDEVYFIRDLIDGL